MIEPHLDGRQTLRGVFSTRPLMFAKPNQLHALKNIARQDGLLQVSYRQSAKQITGKEKGEMRPAHFPLFPTNSPVN